KSAIEMEYDFPDAHLNLGIALADRGHLEEALEELQIAHRQAPDDEMIHHELACCLIDLERYPDAIGHLKKITKQYPEHVEAYVDLGIAYTAQGFLAEAEGILKKALEIDGHDFASHYHLAALYATWGRPQDALDHLEVAATHDREKARSWAREDRLFDPLRHEERYVKLMA
ncbi:MAG: tetratricopeptide repeat protein, partial [Deltaproteobacteria bacterium]|nr:tetratricopeptide repeat protein [Deltaproteobacteria bacterium]